MSVRDRIEPGDFVDVWLGDYIEQEQKLEVLYIPVATGDSWRLRRQDGTVVYVCLFHKMALVQKGERDE